MSTDYRRAEKDEHETERGAQGKQHIKLLVSALLQHSPPTWQRRHYHERTGLNSRRGQRRLLHRQDRAAAHVHRDCSQRGTKVGHPALRAARGSRQAGRVSRSTPSVQGFHAYHPESVLQFCNSILKSKCPPPGVHQAFLRQLHHWPEAVPQALGKVALHTIHAGLQHRGHQD